MNTELEAILQADEEARARLESFEGQAAARIEEARRQAERRRAEQREAARRALEAEVQRILTEADREAGDRRARRASYLVEKEAHAQALLSRAAELYAKILGEGSPAGSAP